MFGVVTSLCARLSMLFFIIQILIFFYIDDKEKKKFDWQKQSLESLTIPKEI